MRKQISRVALAIVALMVAGSAYAHHSYSAYDTTTTFTVEGTVEKIYFVNPHVTVLIKSKDIEYTAEFPAIAALQRNNFTSASLHVGDVVVATGRPMKDRTDHHISLMQELRRPSDGWVWSTGQQQAPQPPSPSQSRQ